VLLCSVSLADSEAQSTSVFRHQAFDSPQPKQPTTSRTLSHHTISEGPESPVARKQWPRNLSRHTVKTDSSGESEPEEEEQNPRQTLNPTTRRACHTAVDSDSGSDSSSTSDQQLGQQINQLSGNINSLQPTDHNPT
jgi:hypothetical protein